MQYIKGVIYIILVFLGLSSCDSKLDVNAEWKDITVVYGLLDQSDSVHYLKITKAFLGPGNALSFAKIPDSSNYQGKLEVRIEGWEISSQYDSNLMQTIHFDTITISNKEEGDSIFYYPHQLVYKSIGSEKLNSNYIYKLFIREPQTGKEINAETSLVMKMPDIAKPDPAPARATFIPGTKNQVEWTSAKGGKRYQLIARFYYLETPKADPSQQVIKSVDWVIFNDLKTENTLGGSLMKYSYSAEVFYTVLGNNIPVDPSVNRAANKMEYIFTVAADDLNTYMEVTEPSFTIVQEKPPFTNIINGIGIFSSRHDNTKDYPIIQTSFSQQTLDELKVNPNTYLLGF
jgi:hypothetical protein